MRIFSLLTVALAFTSGLASAENPHWIWHGNGGKAIQTNEVRYFRKTFEVTGKPSKVHLRIAADDDAIVYLNGKKVGSATGYETPLEKDVADRLKPGENVIAVRGHNAASDVAGVILTLEIKKGKENTYVVTDTSWRASEREETGWTELKFDDSGWGHAVDKGKNGDKPWGEVFKLPKATPVEKLTCCLGSRRS